MNKTAAVKKPMRTQTQKKGGHISKAITKKGGNQASSGKTTPRLFKSIDSNESTSLPFEAPKTNKGFSLLSSEEKTKLDTEKANQQTSSEKTLLESLRDETFDSIKLVQFSNVINGLLKYYKSYNKAWLHIHLGTTVIKNEKETQIINLNHTAEFGDTQFDKIFTHDNDELRDMLTEDAISLFYAPELRLFFFIEQEAVIKNRAAKMEGEWIDHDYLDEIIDKFVQIPFYKQLMNNNANRKRDFKNFMSTLKQELRAPGPKITRETRRLVFSQFVDKLDAYALGTTIMLFFAASKKQVFLNPNSKDRLMHILDNVMRVNPYERWSMEKMKYGWKVLLKLEKYKESVIPKKLRLSRDEVDKLTLLCQNRHAVHAKSISAPIDKLLIAANDRVTKAEAKLTKVLTTMTDTQHVDAKYELTNAITHKASLDAVKSTYENAKRKLEIASKKQLASDVEVVQATRGKIIADANVQASVASKKHWLDEQQTAIRRKSEAERKARTVAQEREDAKRIFIKAEQQVNAKVNNLSKTMSKNQVGTPTMASLEDRLLHSNAFSLETKKKLEHHLDDEDQWDAIKTRLLKEGIINKDNLDIFTMCDLLWSEGIEYTDYGKINKINKNAQRVLKNVAINGVLVALLFYSPMAIPRGAFQFAGHLIKRIGVGKVLAVQLAFLLSKFNEPTKQMIDSGTKNVTKVKNSLFESTSQIKSAVNAVNEHIQNTADGVHATFSTLQNLGNTTYK